MPVEAQQAGELRWDSSVSIGACEPMLHDWAPHFDPDGDKAPPQIWGDPFLYGSLYGAIQKPRPSDEFLRRIVRCQRRLVIDLAVRQCFLELIDAFVGDLGSFRP